MNHFCFFVFSASARGSASTSFLEVVDGHRAGRHQEGKAVGDEVALELHLVAGGGAEAACQLLPAQPKVDAFLSVRAQLDVDVPPAHFVIDVGQQGELARVDEPVIGFVVGLVPQCGHGRHDVLAFRRRPERRLEISKHRRCVRMRKVDACAVFVLSETQHSHSGDAGRHGDPHTEKEDETFRDFI